MNKSRIALASLVMSAAILAPSVAHADPDFDLPKTGWHIGETATLHGTGCINPEGGQTYVGQFVWLKEYGMYAGPDAGHATETPTNPDGSWTWDAGVDAGMPPEIMSVYYCSKAPITNLEETDKLLWVSTDYTLQLTNADGSPITTWTPPAGFAGTTAAASASKVATSSKVAAPSKVAATSKATVSKAAPKSTSTARTTAAVKTDPNKVAGATISTDPDALPRLDKIGIFGPQAAKLKAKVDKDAGRLGAAKLGTLGNTVYVITAFRTLGNDLPSLKELAKYTGELNNGDTRVQVIEEIALTYKTAAKWNKG